MQVLRGQLGERQGEALEAPPVVGEAFVRRLLESSTDCIKVLSLDGQLQFMSEGGMCVMEVDDFEAIRGSCWPDFWTGEEHDKALEAIEIAVAGGVGRFYGYTPTAKGNVRYWDVTVTPIYGEDGRPESLLSISRDITDVKRTQDELARSVEALREANRSLERRVDERTAELQASMKEAEGFNYSIAHDLRSPLRAIASTSGILLEEAGPRLEEEHRELLVRQAHNANRLGTLIDALIRLSRYSRVEVKRVDFDMTEMARGVFGDLRKPDRTNGCAFEAQPGMAASGDVGLVQTVVHNLVVNACKFSPRGGTVRMTQEGATFSVSDEGIGFDMAFAPKIFLPFERLVSEAQFQGTGIGLANVERIVRRHGGRVWAEAAPGKGATFSFTLG